MAFSLTDDQITAELEQLRRARYGTESERANARDLVKKVMGSQYIFYLVSLGYLNAIWAAYTYFYDQIAEENRDYFAKYANIEDRDGTRTVGDYEFEQKIARGELNQTSSHSSSSHGSKRNLREWVLNVLVIGDPMYALNNDPEFLPALANLYLANDPDVEESLRDWYPELKPIVEQYIADKALTAKTPEKHSDAPKSNATDTGGGHSGSTGETRKSTFGTNPYSLYINPTTGAATYRPTKLDPELGSWSFTLANGETVITDDYDEAQIIEAAIYNLGTGPTPGRRSWTNAQGQTVYTYAEAWQLYVDALQNEIASVNKAGTIAQEAQNNQAAWDATQPNPDTYTPQQNTVKTKMLSNTNAAGEQPQQKSNLIWWILGGSAVVLGIGIFVAIRRKNKKSNK